ncbi:MAG: MFS transporter, partial [Rhizobiales bacterium]|nr:MFS transporter [Hyphomicrobiales bacterium]
MTLADRPSTAVLPSQTKAEQRRAMTVGCGAHALHDGYVDILYVMLPLWQAEFGLTYAAVGALRTTYSGTMAALQIPSTMLADRIGAPVVLAVGTALTALCYCLAGISAGFPLLIAALFLGGLGASTQHPIGSALIARAFEGPRAITALGTYNFAGDLGKMAMPAAATLLLWLGLSWRPAVGLLGALGFVAALAILALMPRYAAEAKPAKKSADADAAAEAPAQTAAEVAHLRRGFRLLLLVGAFDSLSRAGFMVFVPFLLIAKGASIATAGFLVTLIFVGGATGKLVCAWIGARFGIIAALLITEILTAVGILGVLFMPLTAALVILPVVGIVLNGSSSLTYGSVPRFIVPGERNRAFGIFYTGTLGAGAISPTLSGALGDVIGMAGAVIVVA